MSRQHQTRTSTSSPTSKRRSQFAAPPVVQPKTQAPVSTPQTARDSVNPFPGLQQTPTIQAKLTLGQPNDRYEKEADQVARNVVQQLHSPITPAAEPGPTINLKPMLQRATALDGGQVSSEVESSINQAKGGGQSLDAGLQQSMSQAMGANFSGVKVHTDSQSDRLNRSIQARAFTTGSDVFFKKGEYNPGSKGGQELIAHELTHVVQQGQAPAMQTKLANTPQVSFPSLQQPWIQRTNDDPIVAKLRLCADVETSDRSKLGLLDIMSADVGHTFLQLYYEDMKGVPETMREPTKSILRRGFPGTRLGFYPLIHREIEGKDFKEEQNFTPGGGASENKKHKGFSVFPWKWVPGRVEEPDTQHKAKISKEYPLTQTKVDQVMNYAESKKNAKYNLYKYNCTNFAIEGVEAAGFSAPSALGGYRDVMLPNGVYKTLYQMSKENDQTVSVKPLQDGEEHETDDKKTTKSTKKTTRKDKKSGKKSGKKRG